jgi:signal transduction histidine kinase
MVTGRGAARARSLFLLIAAVTIVPLCALSWVALRSLDQDRKLDQQQARERVESATDRLAAAIQRAIGSTEQALAARASAEWPAGIVEITLTRDQPEVRPRRRIPYLPVAPALRGVPDEAFSKGEALEFQRRDRSAAIHEYEQLTRSADAAIRAGAVLRLARNLAAAGAIKEASAAYAQLESVDDVGEAGVPVGLAAAWAQCALLQQKGDVLALQRAARNLYGDLETGRWPVIEPTYLTYVADAERWTATRRSRASSELLAAAVAHVWSDHGNGHTTGVTDLRAYSFLIQDEAFTVVFQRSGEAATALIASEAFVESQWLRAAAQSAAEQTVAFRIRPPHADSNSPVGPMAGQHASGAVTRLRAQTDLPWDLEVWSSAPSVSPALRWRRQLVFVGLSVVALLSLVAGVVIARSVRRELAVGRLQSEFVAAVSHEFRTPLTTLRQFTDMLREQPALDAARRQICYDAQARATDRLTHLVESVLDFGRMEAGARQYRFDTIDCAEIAQRVVAEFTLQAPPSCPVRWQPSEPAAATLDREAFSRAIWNLLDNAVKYSPDGGVIDVGVHRSNGYVCVSVRDHGVGIPEHERRAIFEKFRRGEIARARGIKGTGLGLAMVEQIVRAHRGQIDVAAARGGGSTFTIVLPVGE